MALPGTNMRLIDRHRLFRMLPGLAVLHPYIVRPLDLRKICDSGCRARSQLCIGAKRICLEYKLSLISLHTELVHIIFLHIRNKTSIYAKRFSSLHRIRFHIPLIEIAHHGHGTRMRRPHCKIYTFFFSFLHLMGAQLLIDLIVITLSEKIMIQFSDFIWFCFSLCHIIIPHILLRYISIIL